MIRFEAPPGAVFGADIIAGFPTETDAAFANSSLVRNCELIWLHVFLILKGPDAPADANSVDVRKDRAAELRAVGEAQAFRFLDTQIGSVVDVLVEKGSQGRTPHFADVRLTPNPAVD